jgi:hypothetical protein
MQQGYSGLRAETLQRAGRVFRIKPETGFIFENIQTDNPDTL